MKPSTIATSVATALVLSAQLATAETKESVLVVTANKLEQNIDDTLANIEVITRQEIERIQPQSITDLLVTVTGLDVVTQGGAGQNSAIFARGASSDHTLVLINNVRVGSATDGKKALAAIAVDHIERIEIIKGPRASIWGSDAMAAVIHVFTRKMSNAEQSVSLGAGSNEYRSGSYSVGFGNERLNNSLTVTSTASEGFDVLDNGETDDDGYRRVSLSLVGDYALSEALNLNWTLSANQGNSEYDNNWGANESDFEDHLISIQYNYRQENWHANLGYGQSRDYSVAYGNGTTRDENSLFETKRSQINSMIGYQWTNGFQLSGGIDLVKDDLSDSVIVQFGGERAPFDVDSRNQTGGYLYSAYSNNSMTLETSVRHDDIDDVDKDSSFSVAFGYKLSDAIQFTMSRGKGFKAPTFNDLFYPNSGFFAGNPELVSEVSYTNELGFHYRGSNQSLSWVRYQTDFDNLIAFQADENFVTRPFNIEQAFVNGYEINYQLQAGNFHHKLGWSHINATQMVDDGNGGTVKQNLIRRADRFVSYQLGYDFESLSLFAQYRHVGQRPDDDFSTWPATRVLLDSYRVLNLSAQYFVTDNLTVSVKVNDAQDKAKSDVLSYQQPGRESFINVKYQF